MPKGLKSTSSQSVVSFSLTESAPNTLTSERVDLQLNALDQEVFVVTGMKLDLDTPDLVLGGVGTARTAVFASISKQSLANATSLDLGNPSIIGTSQIITREIVDNYGAAQASGYCSTVIEDGTDTPSQLEYVDVIATPDFFVNINGSSNTSTKSVAGKLYGYRARADAATYAALVQSELLSS